MRLQTVFSNCKTHLKQFCDLKTKGSSLEASRVCFDKISVRRSLGLAFEIETFSNVLQFTTLVQSMFSSLMSHDTTVASLRLCWQSLFHPIGIRLMPIFQQTVPHTDGSHVPSYVGTITIERRHENTVLTTPLADDLGLLCSGNANILKIAMFVGDCKLFSHDFKCSRREEAADDPGIDR